jgi:hypothetical protein
VQLEIEGSLLGEEAISTATLVLLQQLLESWEASLGGAADAPRRRRGT